MSASFRVVAVRMQRRWFFKEKLHKHHLRIWQQALCMSGCVCACTNVHVCSCAGDGHRKEWRKPKWLRFWAWVETVSDFIFWGSKITADVDCSHEIKRYLLLGRKSMTNPDSMLKSRDITLPAKVRLVKALVFPVVMYGCDQIKCDQIRSIAQSCPALCNPMNRSTPGLSVHHQLPEFTQTHIHWVSGAIQPSHPLSSPSPPAPNPSQHHSLFQWVNSLHEVAKVLEFQL